MTIENFAIGNLLSVNPYHYVYSQREMLTDFMGRRLNA